MSTVQLTAVVDSVAVADGPPAASADALALGLSDGAVGVEFPQPLLHSAAVAAITNSPVRLIFIPPDGFAAANDMRQLFSPREANSAPCPRGQEK
jgi:hypothetical protein